MIATGIDLTNLQRIKKALGSNPEKFLKRICTPHEIGRIHEEKRQEQKVAGLFALKEAFSKALGTGIGSGVSFHDFEVTYSPKGQPRIEYTGRQFKNSKGWSVSCSVTHEGDIVGAVVVVMGDIS